MEKPYQRVPTVGPLRTLLTVRSDLMTQRNSTMVVQLAECFTCFHAFTQIQSSVCCSFGTRVCCTLQTMQRKVWARDIVNLADASLGVSREARRTLGTFRVALSMGHQQIYSTFANRVHGLVRGTFSSVVVIHNVHYNRDCTSTHRSCVRVVAKTLSKHTRLAEYQVTPMF